MPVVNPNRSKRKLSEYKWGKGIPTRENCDLTDPREMFLWCLIALPGMNGAPLILPIEYLMMISEHLHECGVRLSDDPVKKYRPPTGQEPNWATAPGHWVDAADPDPPRQSAKQVWSELQMLQQAELVDAMFSDDRFWERLPKPLKDKLRRVVDPT